MSPICSSLGRRTLCHMPDPRENTSPPKMPSFNLSPQQQDCVDAVVSGQNVFLTGSAGTGKSAVIQRLYEVMVGEHDKRVVLTASTGVAATNIRGMTLHSWAGIGLGKLGHTAHARNIARTPRLLKRYLETDVLVIDEISMVDPAFLEKINEIAKLVRREKDKAFGGISLVLSGDFLQLQPVNPKGEKYLFYTGLWDELVDRTFCLTQIFRQGSDTEFTTALNRIRVGDIDSALIARIKQTESHTLSNEFGIEPTKLFCKNADVDAINAKRLAALDAEEHVFQSRDNYANTDATRQFEKSLSYPTRLVLKKGAQVMLLKNISVESGLCNGARGVIESISEGMVVIRFANGIVHTLEPDAQSITDDTGKVVASRVQLPLRLAWAITVHKSQGMGIDYLDIDLKGTFAVAQAYVALSRATSFKNMRVRGFSAHCVRTDQTIVDFYAGLLSANNNKRKRDEDAAPKTSKYFKV